MGRKCVVVPIGKGKEKVGETSASPQKKRARPTNPIPETQPIPEEEEEVEVSHGALPTSKYPLPEQPTRFIAKFNRTFICGKSVAKQEFKGYKVWESFEAMGWESILNMRTSFYPELVVQFMSNLRKSSDGKSLKSKVNGKRIVMDVDRLRICFQLNENEDNGFEWENLTKKYHGHFYFLMVAHITGDSDIQGHIMRRIVKRGELLPQAQIFLKIIQSNVNPRKSDLAVVREKDVFIIHDLMRGIRSISFAWFFMQCLWDAFDNPLKGVIPYACLLSRYLRFSKVVNEGDEEKELNKREWFITKAHFASTLRFSRGRGGVHVLEVVGGNKAPTVFPREEGDEEPNSEDEVGEGERAQEQEMRTESPRIPSEAGPSESTHPSRGISEVWGELQLIRGTLESQQAAVNNRFDHYDSQFAQMQGQMQTVQSSVHSLSSGFHDFRSSFDPLMEAMARQYNVPYQPYSSSAFYSSFSQSYPYPPPDASHPPEDS